MFILAILSTFLLVALLLCYKYYFIQEKEISDLKFKKIHRLVFLILVCFAFVSAEGLLIDSFKSDIFSKVTPPYEVPFESGGQNEGNLFENGGNSVFTIIPPDQIQVKLKDIYGMKEAKENAKQFLQFIENPKIFKNLGANPPNGVIIYGPSGTGKTLLVRAMAKEANVTFISASGSSFEDALVGRGASRVRELFAIARENKPAIIFIDEIDALAPVRKQGELQSQIQTTNQLLSEMDGIDQKRNEGIFVIAATNRLSAIDPAILRPGRFDWQLHIKLPTDEDRKEIFINLTKNMPIAKDVDSNEFVIHTAGFSGADIKNLINEAAIFAGREHKKEVDSQSFKLAFSKISVYEKEFSPTLSVNILSSSEIKTRFQDIAGMPEVKNEVTEVVEYLKNPKEFTRLGARPPAGIMIYGPPGTGKTLMARAMAGEAHASFIAISGSAFEEEYVGVGAARVRELFKLARQYKPCIVFIDEFDALAPIRGSKELSGQDQTINQLLSEMDNIQKDLNEGVTIIGATNRLDMIDPAVLRPGRFDRKVYFRLPLLSEREEILKIQLKRIKHDKDVNVKVLAQITTGYSGAELDNLVNEAAIEATRKHKKLVQMSDFEVANDKISLGVQQGTSSYSEAERKLTAYHEAGHALVGLLVSNQPKTFHKMTIGLRNYSLGVTHFRMDTDLHSLNKKELEAMIATALGGYIAEEIIFGVENVTTGAASDLLNANEIAKDMVTKYAMADDDSLIMDEVFPGGEGKIIDNANIILKRDYNIAKKIIETNLDKLHKIANALLEKETLDYEQVSDLLKFNLNKSNP